eukprot:6492799-Amphidinium_carterae.9
MYHIAQVGEHDVVAHLPCNLTNVLPVDDAEDGIHDAIERGVLADACDLLRKMARRGGIKLVDESEKLQTSRKALSKNCAAAAEVALLAQTKSLREVLGYMHERAGISIEPVAFVERQAYDSTPAYLRVQSGELLGNAEQQKVKLWMVETEWLVLFRGISEGGHTAGQTSVIRGFFSPCPRITERGTAECTSKVLQTTGCFELRERISQVFGDSVYRISETDEDPANFKGEVLLELAGHEKWSDSLLHCICSAHKVHKAAERTWSFCLDLMSNLVHCHKVFADIGMQRKVKKVMQREIRSRLNIQRVASAEASLSQEAVSFRKSTMLLFLPPKTQTRRRALMETTCALLNGDWRVPGVLQHLCIGSDCCKSRAETEAKLIALLPRALLCQRAQMLCMDNWLQWHDQLSYWAWCACLHGFGQAAMNIAMMSEEATADMEEDENPDQVATVWEAEGAGTLDEMEIARRERAKSFAIAKAFMKSNWRDTLWTLRVSVQGQKDLMHKVFHLSSADYEVGEMFNQRLQGVRDYPILSLHTGKHLDIMIQAALKSLADDKLWAHMDSTEVQRSTILPSP